MAVHRFEHLQTGAIESDERKVVVERREPPLVVTVLIGDEIRDMPSEEVEDVSREISWCVDDDSRLHDEAVTRFERRSLHEDDEPRKAGQNVLLVPFLRAAL
jgi:hypothetical protein